MSDDPIDLSQMPARAAHTLSFLEKLAKAVQVSGVAGILVPTKDGRAEAVFGDIGDDQQTMRQYSTVSGLLGAVMASRRSRSEGYEWPDEYEVIREDAAYCQFSESGAVAIDITFNHQWTRLLADVGLYYLTTQVELHHYTRAFVQRKAWEEACQRHPGGTLDNCSSYWYRDDVRGCVVELCVMISDHAPLFEGLNFITNDPLEFYSKVDSSRWSMDPSYANVVRVGAYDRDWSPFGDGRPTLFSTD